MKFIIVYENDVDPNDDCFVEYWIVTDGNKEFISYSKNNAEWLLKILNKKGNE